MDLIQQLSVYNQIEFFMAATDHEGKLLWINRVAETVGGITTAQAQGGLFWEQAWFNHSPSVRQLIKEKILFVCHHQEPVDPCEVTVTIADGSLLHIEFHATPYFVGNTFVGALPHAVAIRKLSNNFESLATELLTSVRMKDRKEALLEQVIEFIPTPLLLVNQDGVLIFNNRQARNSISDPENKDKTWEDWDGNFYLEDGSDCVNEQTPLARALLRGELITKEKMYVQPKGSDEKIFIEVDAMQITREGEVLGAVCSWTELS